jgi:hypothetical protein
MLQPSRPLLALLCLFLVACAADPPTFKRDTSVNPGYHVERNKVLDANGNVRMFHGIARPTLEWSTGGENISKGDFALMAKWNANVVRIGLNQAYWLRTQYAKGYQQNILQAVEWAKQAGLDVILDLHWSDRGDASVKPDQQAMPDQNSLAFWKSVAEMFKDDGRVLFELYNEPKKVKWEIWLNGGTVSDTYHDNETGQNQQVAFEAVGMQQLYDAVRAKETTIKHLILIGGIAWAYDLSGVAAYPVKGENIMYVTHPYDYGDKQPADWDRAWGYLTETAPVIITEFGSFDCSTKYTQTLIDYADEHGASWTAWAWYVNGCAFPSIIVDWKGTPSAPGAVVKAALGGYLDGSRPITWPVAVPRYDAAAPEARDSAPVDMQTDLQTIDGLRTLDVQGIDTPTSGG